MANRQENEYPNNPCSSSSGGPEPLRRYRTRTPSRLTHCSSTEWMDSRLVCRPNVPFTAVYFCAVSFFEVARLPLDFRRFLPSNFFNTRIPLSTCFSWSKKG